MQNDKTTLQDLSFFATGEAGIFHLLDHTVTHAGREVLRRQIQFPPANFDDLVSLQETVHFFYTHPEAWTNIISNGTIVLLEKFFESADNAAMPQGKISLLFSAIFQRVLNKSQYSFTQFSISHLSDFINGCKELAGLLHYEDIPRKLKETLGSIKDEIEKHRLTEALSTVNKKTAYKDLVRLSFLARREMKNPVYRLIQHYARLDAWPSLALAVEKNNWIFPVLKPSFPIVMEAKGLCHPLLKNATAYDVHFKEQRNFLLLTGANMSGKQPLCVHLVSALCWRILARAYPQPLSLSVFWKGSLQICTLKTISYLEKVIFLLRCNVSNRQLNDYNNLCRILC